MYAEVIPYGKSFSTETLTYFVGASFREEIKIWQLVEIPYGKNIIFGIVASVSSKISEKRNDIREILNIIAKIPILSEYQIASILKISQKYCLTIHKVLGIFLPSPVLKRLQKYNFPLLQNTFSNKNIHHEIFWKKEGIITSETLFNFFKPNIVIIVPDDIFLENFKKNLSTRDDIFFVPNEMTEAKRSQAWIDIYNQKFSIIIGSRKLLFFNLSAYSEIWYLEDSFFYDYYHYPIRIQHNDVLAHYTESGNFSIKIFSSIPRLRTLSQFHFFQFNHI